MCVRSCVCMLGMLGACVHVSIVGYMQACVFAWVDVSSERNLLGSLHTTGNCFPLARLYVAIPSPHYCGSYGPVAIVNTSQ